MTRQLRGIEHARLRTGTGVKWGSLPADTIGAWVADMDFGIPPAVRQAILEATEREDFGYPHWPNGNPVIEAFNRRMHRRHGWTPRPGRTRIFTDLIQILQVVIESATAPGDGIALHVPNYPPFLASIARSGRRAVPIPMRREPGGWIFDEADLAERLRARDCRLLVLVNPHNPTGRVFTRRELEQLAHLADELDLTVLADEIHADLTYAPARHIPFASLSHDTARRTITATSATKAFNIAALRCAVAHIGDDRVDTVLEHAPLDYFGQPSILSTLATVAAWNDSEPWRDELMTQLTDNRDRVAAWAKRVLGDDAFAAPEATYLAWLDLRHVLNHPAPAALLEHLARVKLSEGTEFSETTDVDTASFARLNFATDSETLTETLRRIEAGLERAALNALLEVGHW